MGNRFTHEGNADGVLPLVGSFCALFVRNAVIAYCYCCCVCYWYIVLLLV